MQESWKKVTGYENYLISNFGNVKSMKNKKEKILKPVVVKGYEVVTLCDKGRNKRESVHRLVALAFLDKPEDKNEVNHIDGNPRNNHIDNLEWCTHLENVRHAFLTGLIERKPLTDDQKRNISEKTKLGMKDPEVKKKLNAPRLNRRGKKRTEETRQRMRDAWVIRKSRGAI